MVNLEKRCSNLTLEGDDDRPFFEEVSSEVVEQEIQKVFPVVGTLITEKVVKFQFLRRLSHLYGDLVGAFSLETLVNAGVGLSGVMLLGNNEEGTRDQNRRRP
ncbi:unnamed protein product [Cuscuta europaea]|uniref:Uncharacterized protein n=1 Tax=Cuscuta europaea TaxID=41803 RepID=A0A9P1EPH0_CUSEU|nr:unnamed protein product [Cuscuta europaea]